ncbi:MAG TPA: glycosyltransferase family 4 protein [Vicinamibacterales bacterium]|nr:glycosyltransferase family 4 protein [Vicinamibacterales bacterium]
MVNALFVNSGILGQRTFSRWVDRTFVQATDIRATQLVLTEQLTLFDRVVRRVACQRLWPASARVKNLDLFRFRAELNAGWLARRRIDALLRAGRSIDVMHFHHQATAFGSVALMRRIPTIISIDCTQTCVMANATSPLELASYGPNVRRDGEIFRAAKVIVSPSQWAANCVRTEYPECEAPIVILPVPVDIDALSESWIDERRARAATPGYRPRVLFVGGDFQRKGGYDLLRVWRERQLGERADLHVMTGASIDPASLSGGVHIHFGIDAHTPTWVDLWRTADLFVLPTRNEAFGMVFQEAAAAGLPAIGPRLNAVPELIADGRTGLLIPPQDDRALAEAIERLLSSADLRHEFGRQARQMVAEQAHPARYRASLMALFERLSSAGDRVHAA